MLYFAGLIRSDQRKILPPLILLEFGLRNSIEHLHQRVPKSTVQPIGFWTTDCRPTSVPKIQLIGTWTWTAGSRVLKSLHLELFLPRSNPKSKRAMSQSFVKEALMRQNCVMADDSASATVLSRWPRMGG
jgi:hypothetical protein